MRERERAEDGRERRRARDQKKSAIAAGTSSCRAAVPGSASVAYEPPCPGPKQKTASERTTSDEPAQREPKTATPASHVTASAIGASSDGSCRTTTPGSTPENHETSASSSCQSGNA